jgi:hypothetical protein
VQKTNQSLEVQKTNQSLEVQKTNQSLEGKGSENRRFSDSGKLFKELVPWEYMRILLSEICPSLSLNQLFVIDLNVYKKMIFLEKHYAFLETLKKHYRLEKHFYITREFTYNSFMTILRQICKSHQQPFHTELKFGRAFHNMVYYVPSYSLEKTSLIRKKEDS